MMLSRKYADFHRCRSVLLAFVLTGVLATAWMSARAATAVFELVPLSPSGQVVGNTITWVARSSGTGSDPWRYRFSVGLAGSPLNVVRDFKQENFFEWTPLEEGMYDIEVTARQLDTGETSQVKTTFEIRSRITGSAALVTATDHPLVFLYSAPSCSIGQMRVRFRLVGAEPFAHTAWKPCQAGKSMNFYVGGLRAHSRYEIGHEIQDRSSLRSSALLRKTTGFSLLLRPFTVTNGADAQPSLSEGVLLRSIFGGTQLSMAPMATDLSGRVIWYYRWRGIENLRFPWALGNYLVRPLPGGTMLLFLNYRGGFDQLVREIDLVGNPLRETNVEELNRQLALRGEEPVVFFSHEALRLSNGHTLILGTVERITWGVQGLGRVDILGDMILDLDENLQVVWTWNPFDHLDVTRKAVLDEKCTIVTAGCPPISQALIANDWTHANAIDYLPEDGNLLLTLRHQDWVVKIDYRDGLGTGQVLWRLGPDGDFALTNSNDPYPWFSHPHDAHFEGNQLLVFDNGNTRCDGRPFRCNSRGQVYELDEQNLMARLIVNADLGVYSPAFGSAQGLSNGNYHFQSGSTIPSLSAKSIEVTPDGEQVLMLETPLVLEYRAFRMRDLYTPYKRN